MANVTSRDGTTIAYEVSGSGPPLILVDAASCYRESGPMRPLAAALAGDFTVYVFDRRGRGESTDTEPYAVEREIEDLAALIEVAGGAANMYGFSSGAVLVMHAAARGLPIPRLAVLEPPIPVQDEPELDIEFIAKLDEFVSTGRRGAALGFFYESIGVPEEVVGGMRQESTWPALEDLAHTLAYDVRISGTLSSSDLARIGAPVLVLDSLGSDDYLRDCAAGIAAALPDARRRSLKGEWHGPAMEDLVPTLTEFLATPGEGNQS
jgi:pimeloyl-ACP methyl ester carboxylesterase